MYLFRNILPAVFVARPNRFLVQCIVNGRKVQAYLPNPGRLWELFFPGVKLFLQILPRSPQRKLDHLIIAVERDGFPVMLHTHANNLVARKLIEEGRIPGLESAEIIKAEHKVGNSRFDFLLQKDGREMVLEVKSCTLFNRTLAMFPDAVSARATKHLLELEELSRTGCGSAVLFIVHSPRATWFMPDYHTDLTFCHTLLAVRDQVLTKAMAVAWEQDLSLTDGARELAIPWDFVEQESHDRGSYIIVLKLVRDRKIEVGALGAVKFRKGFYLYVGSAMKDLSQRVARHQRILKKHHWHVDYLREHAEFHAAIPIRASVDLECSVAASLGSMADWQMPGFGSSDCGCDTHLYGMHDDPVHSPEFIKILLYYRMGRLEEELDKILLSKMAADQRG
jgi:sugar fermentation stimulation protein A